MDAVVEIVVDVDVTCGIHGDPPRNVELAGVISVLAPLGDEFAVGREFLNAIIVRIGDIYVSMFVNSYRGGEMKLTITAAHLAPLG